MVILLQRASGLLRDSFYRNSLLLILNYALAGLIGFVFWGIAARSYPASVIGNVSALFSGLSFVAIAAGLGLQNTMVRYLSSEVDQRAFIGATSALVAGFGAALATLLVVVPGNFALPLLTDGSPSVAVITVLIVIFLAVGPIGDAISIGFRATGSIVVKNVVASAVRIILLPLLAAAGETGLLLTLLGSITLSTVLALVIGLRRAGPRPARAERRQWSASLAGKFQFSAGNYVATLISVGPLAVLPIFVVRSLGPEQGAYFAVCLLLIIALNGLPTTVSQSLFAELAVPCADGRALVLKALRSVYSLVLPAVVVILLIAPWVLGIYGEAYATAAACLRLMAAASLFGAFNYIADVVLNASGRIVSFTVVNVSGAIAVLAFSLGGATLGLTTLGIGWLVGQVVYSMIAGTALMRVVASRRRVDQGADRG